MKVRVGIIGLGYWGPNLLKNFYQYNHCEVVYCCDKDDKRLQVISRQYPAISVTKSSDEVISNKDIDAVVIATPTNTHALLSEQALRNGKHVLVEKPLALSVKDSQKVLKLAVEFKRILMVGHTYEYHPGILKIREYLKKNIVGDIYYIYGSRVNLGKVREETNALWNLAPHDISILRLLLGNLPTEVSAFGESYLRKNHEDVVFISLRFPKKITAHIHVSWLDPSKERKMTIVGSKKMIVFDDLDNEASIRIYDKGYISLMNEKGSQYYKEFALKLRPGDIHLPYIESLEPLKAECEHFIECILNKKTPRSDGKSGLEVVQVLEAAQKSLNKRSAWIEL